jgi:Arc/MetJ-type ribon-helix-helix transcriptional regulator
MTETIPVRIDSDMLETLDLLVELGFYKNRSEAIRELMKKGLEAGTEVKELGKIVKIMERLDKTGKVDLSGLELERERF